MGNRKDIGKLFNERFKDFEQAPSVGLWDNIATELDQESERRIAPFWLYFGGTIIVGILTGILYWAPWDASTTPNTKNQSSFVNTTENTQDDDLTVSSIDKNNTTEANDSENTNSTSSIITNNDKTTLHTKNDSSLPENTNSAIVTSQNRQTTTLKTTSNKNNSSSNNSSNTNTLQDQSYPSTEAYATQKTIALREVLNSMTSETQRLRTQKELEAKRAYQTKIKGELAVAIATQKEENKVALQKWLDSIQTAENAKKADLAKAASVKKEEKVKKEKLPKLPKTEEEREKDRKESVDYKFAVSPYTSLLSYGSLTKGSSIDNRLVDNPRDAIGTVGYGIRADYKFSERSSIRFGVGLAPLQYRTDDFQVLISNNNVNIFQLSGIDPQNLNQTGGIEPSPEALAFFNSNNVVSIEQNISYVEIPVDYQYRFLNKRFSMSFNTGLSLFVLTNNRVFATANSGESIFIGRETSLKDLSLALNLGLGTQYNFTKKWRVDVEPAFKYQLNPYTDNIGNFKPYYFGLQFGISYKF